MTILLVRDKNTSNYLSFSLCLMSNRVILLNRFFGPPFRKVMSSSGRIIEEVLYIQTSFVLPSFLGSAIAVLVGTFLKKFALRLLQEITSTL